VGHSMLILEIHEPKIYFLQVKMRRRTLVQATGHDSHHRLGVLLITSSLVHRNP